MNGQGRRRGTFHGPRTGCRTGRILGIAVAGLTPAGITGRGTGGGVGATPAERIGGRDERGGDAGAGRRGTTLHAGSTPAANCCEV